MRGNVRAVDSGRKRLRADRRLRRENLCPGQLLNSIESCRRQAEVSCEGLRNLRRCLPGHMRHE